MTMQEPSSIPDELELEAEEALDSPMAGLAELPAEVYYGGAAGFGLLAVIALITGRRLPGILLAVFALLFGLYGQQRQSEEMDAFDELELLPGEESSA